MIFQVSTREYSDSFPNYYRFSQNIRLPALVTIRQLGRRSKMPIALKRADTVEPRELSMTAEETSF
jgi:hypothetical protein